MVRPVLYSGTATFIFLDMSGISHFARSRIPDDYSGAGGKAPGGSVYGTSGLVNVFSGNAGSGGDASSGDAGVPTNSTVSSDGSLENEEDLGDILDVALS